MTTKQRTIAELISSNALKFNAKEGYHYYSVPADIRRSGYMKVSVKEYNRVIEILKK